jgi:tetratricopeptide (TPR) repeat protein
MSKTEITLKKPVGEPDVVQANDVAKIEWEGGGPDLKLGYSDENGGRLDAAVIKYSKAKTEAKSPSAYLSAEFDYVLARVNARIALADPEKQAAAVQQLIAVQKAHPEHFRYYESVSMLGRLQLEMGDFAAARTTFDQLAKSPWSDFKLASKIASGRILVAENKLDEAVKEFEAAAAAATDSPADQARKYEAMLGQARALVAQSKFEDALKILDLVTDKGPTEDSAVQAEGYVLQGNCLQALGRLKEAALAYLHVDILFPQETGYHAEALFNLTKTWKQVQLPERSAEAEAKLVQKYPDSPWRKKLAAN